jgi:SNF2 family DNA or RNA helicase
LQLCFVSQWVAEARTKLNVQNLSIYEYHGATRTRDAARLAQHDIVVTTYETVAGDRTGRAKKHRGTLQPLCCIKWWRLVLDDSHSIKDASSEAAQAVRAIQVQHCAWHLLFRVCLAASVQTSSLLYAVLLLARLHLSSNLPLLNSWPWSA